MTAHEGVICGCSPSILFNLLISDSVFLDILLTLLAFSKMLELNYGFSIIEAITKDFGAELKGSKFLQRENLTTCKQKVCLYKTMLR